MQAKWIDSNWTVRTLDSRLLWNNNAYEGDLAYSPDTQTVSVFINGGWTAIGTSSIKLPSTCGGCDFLMENGSCAIGIRQINETILDCKEYTHYSSLLDDKIVDLRLF